MNCLREVTTSFELELDSRIEISIIGSNSSANHLTRSKFGMCEDTGLNALEVASVTHPSEVDSICVTIMGGSESDHYTFLLNGAVINLMFLSTYSIFLLFSVFL